jgi:hypothetical protein
MGEFLKLPPTSAPPGPTPQDVQGCAFAAVYPCLHEWLTLTRWEDGSARVPASLTLFFDDGRVKACLSDREQQRVAFVAGWTFSAVLEALEEGLVAHSLDWRPARGRSDQKGRRPT